MAQKNICEYCRKIFNRDKMQRFCSNSCAMKAKWENDTFRKKQKIAHKDQHHTEEAKRKISEAKKGHTTGMAGKHHNEETKAKISQSNLGKKSWSKGKHLSEDHKCKISKANKGKHFGKISWNKGLTKLTDERVAQYGKNSGNSRLGKEGPKYSQIGRKNCSISALKRCRENMGYWKKLQKSLNLKPNNQEKRLDFILQNFFPNEYKYVGDFSFILGGKSPDFMNINGKKKLIELYGVYWHRDDDPQDRIDFFKQFGFDTLVIWENELEDKNKLKVKLENFHICEKEVIDVI